MPPSGEAWGPRAAPARKPDSEAQSGAEDARFLDCPVITNYPFWEWPLCLKSHFPPSVVPVFELFVLCTLLKNQNSGPFCCMPVTRHRASGASSRPPWGGRGLSCAPIRRVLVSAGRSARSAWHVSIRRCSIRTSCPPISLPRPIRTVRLKTRVCWKRRRASASLPGGTHAGPWTAPHDAGLGWGWGRGEAEALPSKGRAVRSLWGCWTRPRPPAAGTALCCVCALSGGRSLWEPRVGLGQQTGGGPRRPPSMQDPGRQLLGVQEGVVQEDTPWAVGIGALGRAWIRQEGSRSERFS